MVKRKTSAQIGSALFLLLGSGIVFLTGRSLARRIIKRLITRKFPTVEWITTEEFARWLEDPAKLLPILLDARSEAEYAISHLKDSQRIDPNQPDLAAFTESKDTPIVVYCSVGYRSARVAEQLGETGFSRVYNLEGSIFQWANEGRPVCKDDSPTMLVHPYDALWGRLLRSEYRAQVAQGGERGRKTITANQLLH